MVNVSAIEREGDEAKIAFNGRYLTDVLSVLHETQVALETTNPSSPSVIRPGGEDKYVHVVMPMFTRVYVFVL